MANDLSIVKQFQDEISKIQTQIKALKTDIISLSKVTREVNFSGIKSPKGINKALKETNDNTEQLNSLLKEQDRLEKNLINTQSKLTLATESTNRALIKERFELQQQNKLIKEAAVLSSRYSTQLQKATTIRNKLARTIQDLNVKRALGIKLSNQEQKELKQSTSEFRKYDKAIKKAKTSVGRFQENVGNYPKLLGSITSLTTGLIGSFGIIEGLRLGFDFAKESLALAREAKGVEFAFKRLGIEGISAFENIKKSTRGLLSDLDIKRSLNEFSNFNISLKQTDVLFEFLAVRAAQTGRSIDSLKDSLVEGLSKESKLRIDNLGISAAKLNDELKKTPNFVEAVANIAKTEIAQAGSILDDAANSQEKFNAAFENFKVSAGSGFIASLTNSVYELGNALLSSLANVNDASDGFLEFLSNLGRLTTGQGALVASEAIYRKELKKRKPLVEEIIKLQKEQGVIELQLRINKDNLLKTNSKELIKILESLKPKQEVNKLDKENIKNTKKIIELREKAVSLSAELEKTRGKEINDAKEIIKVLKEISKTDSSFELPEIDQDKLKEFQDKINEEFVANLKIQIEKDKLTEGLNDLAGTIESVLGISADKFLSFFDKITQKGIDSFEEIGDVASASFELAGSVSNAFFQGKIDGYQEDIDANNEYYNSLLENENLTTQERTRLETDRKLKEDKLKKEQQKERAKQFEVDKAFRIAQIAIDTATAIVTTGANLGYPAAIPFQIAAGVIGATQIALVASQSAPKFKDGHLSGTHEGLAIVNDAKGSNFREVIERKDGTLEMYKGRDQAIIMERGDKVHKAGTHSAESYFNGLPDSEILNNAREHSMLATISHQNYIANNLSNKMLVDSTKAQTDRIVKAISKQKMRFKVQNNVSLGDDLRYLKSYNDTL